MKINTKKRIYSFVLAESLALSIMSGCAKNVKCDIDKPHAHMYVNESNGLKRFIESEKEKNFSGDIRTDDYAYLDDYINKIIDNKFYRIKDNKEALESVLSTYQDYREVYTNDYRYGTYIGYDYGYNYMTGDYEYFYGQHTGYHWDWDWDPIPMDQYTNEKVREVTYTFKFYKMDSNGNITSKNFKSLDEVI